MQRHTAAGPQSFVIGAAWFTSLRIVDEKRSLGVAFRANTGSARRGEQIQRGRVSPSRLGHGAGGGDCRGRRGASGGGRAQPAGQDRNASITEQPQGVVVRL